MKRALKVLSEREVSPQLGLLKSTLLQLDSTFSERDYGASSFRDFIEKVALTGAVTLRHAGRSMLVEPNDEVLATVTGEHARRRCGRGRRRNGTRTRTAKPRRRHQRRTREPP